MDGNGLQLEKIEAKFVSARLQIIDVDDRLFSRLFSHCVLRLYLHLDVQRKCSEWIKLASTNF